MKKIIYKCLFVFLLIGLIGLFLNIPVTTQKGIDFKCYSIKLPLYLKLLDFYDRHFNYKVLTKKIIGHSKTDEDKVMRLFRWTYRNIRKDFENLPIIDDHVWYIIVRGYGVDEQLSDVFTTLCNYAGINAFFSKLYEKNGQTKIVLSFINLRGKWYCFDPYRCIYFIDKNGHLADIDMLKNTDGWTAKSDKKEAIEIDYHKYFENLDSIDFSGLKRANVQSPFKRLLFQIEKIVKK